MSEKLYINIQEPCHEDWNKTSPVQQGRFCGSCQKKVVDFTTQTDEEIISFFNNYNGSACGRFNDDQLDRPIQQIEVKPASSFLKYAAGLLLPAFLFATKTNGQSNHLKPAITSEPVKCDAIELLAGKTGLISIDVKSALVRMNGTVIDATSMEPLAGVSVMITGTNEGVVTDAKGAFSILVPSKKAVLQFSSIGYEAKEIRCNKATKFKGQRVEMKPSASVMLGEVIVAGYQSRRMGGISGGISIRTESGVSFLNTILPAKVNIYPNPVAASGTIQLSFNNAKPGQYHIRLLNAAGQLFYSFQKQVLEKGDTEQLHLGNTISAGIYIIQILDEKKKLLQSSKLIVQ